MKIPLQFRNAALVAALAAVTATAWATTEYVTQKDIDTVMAQAAEPEVTPLSEPAVAPAESLTPDETLVPEPAAAPAAPQQTAQPPITIEDRRLTLDERIQANVMDLLAQSPNLSGKIGVESKDQVVTLSGYTATSGQAQRAGRYAGSVEGVKYVQNDLRYRVGSSH